MLRSCSEQIFCRCWTFLCSLWMHLYNGNSCEQGFLPTSYLTCIRVDFFHRRRALPSACVLVSYSKAECIPLSLAHQAMFRKQSFGNCGHWRQTSAAFPLSACVGRRRMPPACNQRVTRLPGRHSSKTLVQTCAHVNARKAPS